MHKKKKSVCMLCGKPSTKSICDSCAARVQGEALGKSSRPPASRAVNQKSDKPKK